MSGFAGGTGGCTDVDKLMAMFAPPELARDVAGDRPGRIASGARAALATGDAYRNTDLDQQSSDTIYKAVRRVMDKFHALEKLDRIRVVAPRKGPDSILLTRFNTNDPDHAEGQFALFAADPSALHIVRPGYSLDDVERVRPALGQPCDWQMAGCDDAPGVYRRAACDQYVVLFATCLSCYSNLNPIGYDDDENGGST